MFWLQTHNTHPPIHPHATQIAEKILGDFLSAHSSLLGTLRLQTSEAQALVQEFELQQAEAQGGVLYVGGPHGKLGPKEAAEAEAACEASAASKAKSASLKDLVELGSMEGKDQKRAEVRQ